MVRIQFTDELSPASRSAGDMFPKLKLKNGEKARIALLEGPERVWVHQLYEPVIENGKGVLVDKPRRDGGTFQAYDEKFVKSFQCLGEEETVYQSGVDVTHCPACKASTQFERFKPPAPRYALNVVKYNTRPGSAEVTTPFGVSVIIWVFGPQKHEQIRNLAKEGYDFSKHDLILGPCTHEEYQKYDMVISPKAEWRATEETTKLTNETFRANRVESLAKVVSPELDNALVGTYIERIKHKWDIVNGIAISATDAVMIAAEVSAPVVQFDVTPSVPSEATTSSFDSLLEGIDFG